MKNKFDLSIAQWFSANKKKEFLKKMDSIIKEHTLCIDGIVYVEPLKTVTCFCYDDDLARFFKDAGITLGMSHNVRKKFEVDQDGEVVGLKHGDYIEQLELKQNGNTYLVPVYCCWNGCSLDYGIALYEAQLTKDNSNQKDTKKSKHKWSMYEHLKPHIGHNIVCVCYGDIDNPHDVCIECEDCGEVLISAEDYDLEGDKHNEIV